MNTIFLSLETNNIIWVKKGQQSQIRKVQIRKVQIRQGYKYGNKGGNKYGKANVTYPATNVTNPARTMLHIRQMMLQIRQQWIFRKSVQKAN